MSGGSSWRSPSTADQYRDHDYADFAQEFLNRNCGYQADYADTQARIAQSPETASNEQEGLARRWGLCFPQRSSFESARSPRAVVTGRGARRGHRRSGRSESCDPAAARR
ncbi:transcriptional regulator domain-containing protein [Novosphingobium sp. UBA6272]|uniref:transcriptional regulator domain-containing protein n=1 Tax=Novosphingobium sp. UBA6272 TaxID=1946984 RepID=UPI0039C942BB